MAKAAIKSKSKTKPLKKSAVKHKAAKSIVMKKTGKKVAKKTRVDATPQRPANLQATRKDQTTRFKRTGSAHLTIQGSAPVEFPVYKAVEGASVIDISKLYASTGHFDRLVRF